MLAKLVKLVILTRFSKPLLGLVAFFLVYETVIGSVTVGQPGAYRGFSYYAIGASILFMTVSLLFGGLFVMKSDRDYLLTLPLSRRDLSISLFVAQFLGSGITILFLYGFFVSSAGDLLTSAVLVANLTLLACVVTALGVVSNLLVPSKKVALSILLGVWCLSSIFGVPLTPVSAFTGSLLYGSIAMLLLAAAVVPVGLRELAYLELGSLRTLMRSTSSEYKQNMSFSGKSPRRAIYSYHLSFLEIVGRFNLGGSTSYKTTRVKTRIVLLISTIAASAYLIITALSPLGGLLPLGHSWRPIVFILPIITAVVTMGLMSTVTFSNERGWLAFTAMDPARYLRHLLLSRLVSTLAIVGPFGAADVILGLFGDSSALQAAVIILATTPAASTLANYAVARLGAVQQVKEEGMMPGQFDLRQFVVALVIYAVIALVIASELSLIGALVIASVLGFFTVLVLSRASTWRSIASRLTEKGFV